MFKPQKCIFTYKDNTPDGIGGTKSKDVTRGELWGFLDMINADNNLAIQKAPIEDGKYVFIVRPQDNRGSTVVPIKGDKMTDRTGKVYEVTYVDDPVGVGHHLEILLDNLPHGVR